MNIFVRAKNKWALSACPFHYWDHCGNCCNLTNYGCEGPKNKCPLKKESITVQYKER